MRSCQYGSVKKNMWNPIRKTIRQRTSPEFRRFHKEKHWPVSCHFLRARRNPLRNQSVNTRVPNSRFKESIKYEWYIFFSQLASGRNSYSEIYPAIWLVPQGGEIFLSRPPRPHGHGGLIYFRERITVDRQSFTFITHCHRTINKHKFISIQF